MKRLETDALSGDATPTGSALAQTAEPIGADSRESASGIGASRESDREVRLIAVLTAHLQAVESRQGQSREDLLAAHPDLADDLAAFLDQEDRLQRLLGPPPRDIGAMSSDSMPFNGASASDGPSSAPVGDVDQ
jgi:hypothetical protein